MRFRIWARRVAIVWGIELLALGLYIAWASSSAYSNWANCYIHGQSPTHAQDLRAAYDALDFYAKQAGLSADQFFLLPGGAYESEFVFQVKDDRERPRQITVTVDNCLDTEPKYRNLHPRW